MARSFIKIFHDWLEITEGLTEAEKGRLVDAAVAYSCGKPYQLTGNERLLFPVIRAQIDRDAAAYEEICRKRRVAGAEGGKQKHANASKSKQDLANASKSSEERRKKKEDTYTPYVPHRGECVCIDFLEFWSVYPRKVSKQAAIKAWDKLAPDAELSQQIMQTVERLKRCSEWQREGGRFIPYPSTFLNGRRWEDEINEPVPETPRDRALPEYYDPPDVEHLYE